MFRNWQYNAIRAISVAVGFLPYKRLLALGNLLGPLYYRLAAKQRRLAITQIRQCLRLEQHQAEKIIKQLFVNMGCTFLEILYMPALTPEKIAANVEIENEEYLNQALAEGRGVVLLTAHFGNWEWLGAALSMAGFPMTAIMKSQPNAQMTRILNDYRRMVGLEIYDRDTSDLVNAAHALRQGKVLGFLADQDGGPKGAFIPFLGRMSSTPLGPAAFARKFNAPIVPIFIHRRKQGGHRIEIQKPFYYESTGQKKEDDLRLTIKINEILDAVIRENPEEWLWFQKRWNTQGYDLREKRDQA